MPAPVGVSIDGYASAISELGRQMRWPRALLMLTKLERRQLEGDIKTFTAALGACGSALQWAKALELLSEVQRRQVETTSVTYNCAILACQRSSELPQALRLFQEMEAWGGDEPAYEAVLKACVEGEAWERALSLLRDFKGHSAKREGLPDMGISSYIYNYIYIYIFWMI